MQKILPRILFAVLATFGLTIGHFSHAASASATVGQAVTLSVAADGTAPFTHQWRKNGNNIANATSATYTIPAVAASDAAAYSVVMSNAAGSVTSDNATLTVNAAVVAPIITAQPASLTVNAGQSASFSVTASGSDPLAYQWRKNGTNISGATSSTYSIGSTTTGSAGFYSVVVSNSAGSATSVSATWRCCVSVGTTARLAAGKGHSISRA